MGKKILDKKLRIAVYSGSIPSTPFIENLIEVVADRNNLVYLFGKFQKRVRYKNKNIRLYTTPVNQHKIFIFIIFQTIHLILKSPRKFLKLLIHYLNIRTHDGIYFFQWWSKVLPVVNHLPDIFHIQWAKNLSQWFFLKDIFDVKIILSLRGAHINYSPLADEKLLRTYRDLFPKLDAIHAVSTDIAKTATKYGAIEKSIRVIYSCVDIKLISGIKNNFSVSSDIFHFISVGRFHWKKGYRYAISAINILLKKGYNIDYKIVAPGEPSEEILYQVNDLDLSKRVEFIRVKSQLQVYQKIKQSNSLILPSVEEGIANVVLESMALGTPVISSDCGGMNEVVKNNNNGYLFKNRDSLHLAEVMQKMVLLRSEIREEMIINAKNHIEKNHNPITFSDEFNDFYNSLY